MFGAPKSGKSALLSRILGSSFSLDYKPTEDFRVNIEHDSFLGQVQFRELGFDFGSKFRQQHAEAVQSSDAVVVVVDLSNPDFLRTVAENSLTILVGTKLDLPRLIPRHNLVTLAEQTCSAYFETSANTLEAVRPADRVYAREPDALLTVLVTEVLRPHVDRQAASQAAEKVDALIDGDDFLLQLANELSLDTPPERKGTVSKEKVPETVSLPAIALEDVPADLVDLARKPDDFVSQLTSLLTPVDLSPPARHPPPVPSRPQKAPSFTVGQAVLVVGHARPAVIRQVDPAAGTCLVALDNRQEWVKVAALAPVPFTAQDTEVRLPNRQESTMIDSYDPMANQTHSKVVVDSDTTQEDRQAKFNVAGAAKGQVVGLGFGEGGKKWLERMLADCHKHPNWVNLTSAEATARMKKMEPGSLLVRPSSAQSSIAITFKNRSLPFDSRAGLVQHIRIGLSEEGLQYEEDTLSFPTLTALTQDLTAQLKEPALSPATFRRRAARRLAARSSTDKVSTTVSTRALSPGPPEPRPTSPTRSQSTRPTAGTIVAPSFVQTAPLSIPPNPSSNGRATVQMSNSLLSLDPSPLSGFYPQSPPQAVFSFTPTSPQVPLPTAARSSPSSNPSPPGSVLVPPPSLVTPEAPISVSPPPLTPPPTALRISASPPGSFSTSPRSVSLLEVVSNLSSSSPALSASPPAPLTPPAAATAVSAPEASPPSEPTSPVILLSPALPSQRSDPGAAFLSPSPTASSDSLSSSPPSSSASLLFSGPSPPASPSTSPPALTLPAPHHLTLPQVHWAPAASSSQPSSPSASLLAPASPASPRVRTSREKLVPPPGLASIRKQLFEEPLSQIQSTTELPDLLPFARTAKQVRDLLQPVTQLCGPSPVRPLVAADPLDKLGKGKEVLLSSLRELAFYYDHIGSWLDGSAGKAQEQAAQAAVLTLRSEFPGVI